MSKSLGNFFTVRDLLDQGVPGEVIRFVFLSTHYRKPMDWTEAKRAEAETTLRKWRGLAEGVTPGDVSPLVINALADDLNTAGALTHLHALSKDAGKIETFVASAQMLGLLTDEMGGWDEVADLSAFSDKLSEIRQEAMVTKDFSRVDALKTELIAAGLDVRMSKAGVELVPTSKFDPSKLEGLL